MSTHEHKDNTPLLRTIAAYGVCIGLIPLYVNLFPLWSYLNARFGTALFIYLPALVTAIMVAAIIAAVRRDNHPGKRTVLPGAIIVGVLLCMAGLIVPDPAFPVKRIHVAEYLFLSLVARFAMAPFLKGNALLFFSSCFAAVLGMHDEFLQGIHPARTYGLRDMTVNALGSFGGGLIAHGLSLFTPGPSTDNRADTGSRSPATPLYLCWLLAGSLMLSIPAVFFRGMAIELWTIVPLLGSVVCYSLYRQNFHPGYTHGITALSWAAWCLVCYPLATGVGNVVFH